MKEKPQNLQKESILSGPTKWLIFGISFIVGFLCLFLFWYVLKKSEDLVFSRTLVFASVAIVDLVYIFSFKNLKKPLFKTENFFQNKFLFFGVIYGFALTLAAIYLPALNKILGTQPLGLNYWPIILGIALIATLWAELVKFISNQNFIKSNKEKNVASIIH